MAAAIAILLFLAALGLALLPLALGSSATGGGATGPHEDERRRELERIRDGIVASIRDVDLDLAMGKLSEDDHRDLRASLKAQAVEILQTLDGESEAARRGRAGGDFVSEPGSEGGLPAPEDGDRG